MSSPENQSRSVWSSTFVADHRSPLASFTAAMCGWSARRSSVSVAIGVPVRAGMS